MTRAPVINSVQQGSQAAGQILAQAGQSSLNRLTQAMQFQNQMNNSIAQAEAQRQLQRDTQAASIAAAHQQQVAQIQAASDSQKFIADEQMKRMIVGSGLEEEAKKQAFENSLTIELERARNQAATFDQKFTSEQRVKDAKLQSARKAIQASPDLDDRQKAEALMRLDTEIATNSNPTQVLGDPNNKPRKDGRQPGDIWTDETTGALMSVDPDGTNRMHATFDKTQAGVQMKLQAERDAEINKSLMEREKAAQEVENKRSENLHKIRSDFVSGMIKDNAKAEPGKRMSASQMKEAVKQYMEVMGEDEQKPASGNPQQELVKAAQESGGTVEFTTPSGEKRSYTFKGRQAQTRDVSNVQAGESEAWLRNAQRQYGSLQAMPPEIRKQAQMHARRFKAAKAGR